MKDWWLWLLHNYEKKNLSWWEIRACTEPSSSRLSRARPAWRGRWSPCRSWDCRWRCWGPTASWWTPDSWAPCSAPRSCLTDSRWWRTLDRSAAALSTEKYLLGLQKYLAQYIKFCRTASYLIKSAGGRTSRFIAICLNNVIARCKVFSSSAKQTIKS